MAVHTTNGQVSAELGDVDVVVVGGGNAGHSAALAAAERGRRVVLLEKGRRGEHGGNSYYTAGAMRVVHAGLDDVRDLIDDDERLDRTELPPYSAEDYTADMERVTEGRNDADLTATLVAESAATMRWLHGHGLRFRLMYERQAYANDRGDHVFWGGLAPRQHRGRQGAHRAARGGGASSGRAGALRVWRHRPRRRGRRRGGGLLHRRDRRRARAPGRVGDPGRGWVRGGRRDARAVPRRGLGPGEGARDTAEHR